MKKRNLSLIHGGLNNPSVNEHGIIYFSGIINNWVLGGAIGNTM